MTAKDLALGIIGQIGTDGATGHVIEYAGEAVRALSMEGRMTLCNMSIEAGARAGMVAPDEITFAYVKGKRFAPQDGEWNIAVERWRSLASRSRRDFRQGGRHRCGAAFSVRHLGHQSGDGGPGDRSRARDRGLKESDRRATELALQYMGLEAGKRIEDIGIERVFIGSCTNSRLEDLRAAARVAKGHHVSAKVRAMVVPGSQAVKRAAEQEGLASDFSGRGLRVARVGLLDVFGNESRYSAARRALCLHQQPQF